LPELIAGAFVGQPPDTAQLLLALAAAWLVLRCDRALFEHRKHPVQQSPNP